MYRCKNQQFHLTVISSSSQAVPFRAYFDEGSASEFTVRPQSGELPAASEPGTAIQIIYQPTYYGKPKKARLIVQVSALVSIWFRRILPPNPLLQSPEMEWSYLVIGESPVFDVPQGVSSQPIAGPHPDPRVRGRSRNFIRENMKLISTAVSAPVKGAPILPRL